MNAVRRWFAGLSRWCFGEAVDDGPEVYPYAPSLLRRRQLGTRFMPRIEVAPQLPSDRCKCATCHAKRHVIRVYAGPPN